MCIPKLQHRLRSIVTVGLSRRSAAAVSCHTKHWLCRYSAPTFQHGFQHGFIDPRLFEDSPDYLLPFAEIPSKIVNLFDDWGQSIPISLEVICDEPDLAGTIIEINKEPLQLEYEGADTYTYTITIQFDTKVDWHVAIASAVVPYYFVVNQ